MKLELIAGALLLALAACAKSEQPPAAADTPVATPVSPPVIDVNAADYAFQIADTIPGGWVTFRLHNTGTELHHGQLVRLEQGKTVADLTNLTGHAVPDWVVPVGGPSAPPPGGTLETTLQLTPGNYVLTCMIPSPDGVLHIAKGMLKPLTVVAALAEATPTAADVVVTLSDYDFTFSKPLAAGKQTVEVVNAPGQQHEIVVVQLTPGKTADELVRWVEKMAGPPPGQVVGGTAGLIQGQVNRFDVELTPGDYAIVCFIPDAKDGLPHAAHGMVKQIKIA